MLFKNKSSDNSMMSSAIMLGIGVMAGVALFTIVKKKYKCINDTLENHRKNKFYKIVENCREEYAEEPLPVHNLINDDTTLTEPVCSSIK